MCVTNEGGLKNKREVLCKFFLCNHMCLYRSGCNNMSFFVLEWLLKIAKAK